MNAIVAPSPFMRLGLWHGATPDWPETRIDRRSASGRASQRSTLLWRVFSVFGLVDGDASGPTSSHGALPAIPFDGTSISPRMMIIAGSLDRPAEIARSGTPTGASARKVAEARLLSGLTWDELARAMSASRRSLHFWANGRPIGAPNEERLARLLAALRMTDRGTGTANRAAIIGPDAAGRVPLDLLAAGLFEEFKASLGPGRGRARSTIPVSAAAHAERAPLPPAAYLGALQDPVPTEPMPLVRGRLLRRQKRSA